MFQSIIRDPGGNRLVRIRPDIQPVDGSKLIVPADTDAYFVLNGNVSDPYPPGSHTINTGVSPFFVRLRHLMTRGDPGISVTVFFVARRAEAFFSVGTGELLFREREHNINLKALASANLTFRVSNSRLFLQRLVGMHSAQFYEDEAVDGALKALLQMPLKEGISRYLSQVEDLGQINTDLHSVSQTIEADARVRLREYGLELHRLDMAGINIPDSELQRVQGLQEKAASGQVELQLELQRLRQVYGDRIELRMLDNLISNRGAGGSVSGDMLSTVLSYKLIQQLLSDPSSPLGSLLAGQSDLFRRAGARQDPSNPAAPPSPSN